MNPRDPAEPPPPEPGRRVDVAIAEFNALSAEILDRRGNQQKVIGLALTAYGVIFALALGDGGSDGVLLVIPPLGLVLYLIHLGESFHIHKLGNYIRDELWPPLSEFTGYKTSWHLDHSNRMWSRSTIATAGLTDAMVSALLVGGGITAVLAVNDLSSKVLVAEIVVVLLNVLAAIVAFFMLRRLSRADPEA